MLCHVALPCQTPDAEAVHASVFAQTHPETCSFAPCASAARLLRPRSAALHAPGAEPMSTSPSDGAPIPSPQQPAVFRGRRPGLLGHREAVPNMTPRERCVVWCSSIVPILKLVFFRHPGDHPMAGEILSAPYSPPSRACRPQHACNAQVSPRVARRRVPAGAGNECCPAPESGYGREVNLAVTRCTLACQSAWPRQSTGSEDVVPWCYVRSRICRIYKRGQPWRHRDENEQILPRGARAAVPRLLVYRRRCGCPSTPVDERVCRRAMPPGPAPWVVRVRHGPWRAHADARPCCHRRSCCLRLSAAETGHRSMPFPSQRTRGRDHRTCPRAARAVAQDTTDDGGLCTRHARHTR